MNHTNNLVYNPEAVIEVTKEFTFDSSHNLLKYEGACARLHGHTYKLQITVEGVVNNIGIVLDFKDLKKVVEDKIKNQLDHYYLNEVFEFNTTAENMVVWIFDNLKHWVANEMLVENRYMKLKEVKLWETPTSYASYKDRIAKPNRGNE